MDGNGWMNLMNEKDTPGKKCRIYEGSKHEVMYTVC
jgi:hypothetical protein